jgi:hypothetical protein
MHWNRSNARLTRVGRLDPTACKRVNHRRGAGDTVQIQILPRHRAKRQTEKEEVISPCSCRVSLLAGPQTSGHLVARRVRARRHAAVQTIEEGRVRVTRVALVLAGSEGTAP